MKRKTMWLLVVLASSTFTGNSEEKLSPAPAQDRVDFPNDYTRAYQVLRIVNKPDEQKVVTVYGNRQAAFVTNSTQLPYPYGSVIVMETAVALKDPQGKPLIDEKSNLRKDKVTGLHVMRRGPGFGEAYGNNRAGEWEFVEYRPDGSYITPPQKSAACAACHVKAGQERDFVYRGRLLEAKSK
jgi:cytochrome P460